MGLFAPVCDFLQAGSGEAAGPLCIAVALLLLTLIALGFWSLHRTFFSEVVGPLHSMSTRHRSDLSVRELWRLGHFRRRSPKGRTLW